MSIVVISKRNARLKMKRNVTMWVEGRDERRGGETVDQKGKNEDYILGKRVEEVEEFQYRLCFCWLQDKEKTLLGWQGDYYNHLLLASGAEYVNFVSSMLYRLRGSKEMGRKIHS